MFCVLPRKKEVETVQGRCPALFRKKEIRTSQPGILGEVLDGLGFGDPRGEAFGAISNSQRTSDVSKFPFAHPGHRRRLLTTLAGSYILRQENYSHQYIGNAPVIQPAAPESPVRIRGVEIPVWGTIVDHDIPRRNRKSVASPQLNSKQEQVCLQQVPAASSVCATRKRGLRDKNQT